MKSVRLHMLFSLLVACFAFASVGAGASWADSNSQLIDVSHQVSDLQTQIANAQQHNQALKTGQLTASESCGFGSASQVFGQFGDNGYYALPSKGDLANWSLNNVGISGNHDPYSQAQYSLTLSGNAQITSATYCVGASNNAVRLFLQNNGPSNADLKVNLLYEGADGNVQNVTIAKLQAGSTWQPSIAIPLALSALASSYPGGLMPVAFQFQPEGLGNGQTWSLDGLSFAQPAPGPVVPTPTTSFQSAIAPATTTQPSSSAPVTQASTSTVSSSTDTSQLVDDSHQIADIQNQIAKLKAGQTAKQGTLSLNATCGYQTSSQVFQPWGDTAFYALAAQGALGGWGLQNVSLSSDHDPFTTGNYSLSMTAGNSQALSPTMCVNLTNPTIRLFAKDSGGNGKSDIKVTVLYEDLNGNIQQLQLAKLRVGSNWQPTIPIPIGVNFLSTASASGVTAVAFLFQPEGLQKGETMTIDNLYVDPFCGR